MKGGKRKCNRNGRFEGKRVKTAAGTKLAGKGTSLGYAETQNTDVGIKRSENDRSLPRKATAVCPNSKFSDSEFRVYRRLSRDIPHPFAPKYCIKEQPINLRQTGPHGVFRA